LIPEPSDYEAGVLSIRPHSSLEIREELRNEKHEKFKSTKKDNYT